MMNFPSIHTIISESSSTLKRFPLAIGCAVLASILFIINVEHDFEGYLNNLILVAILGISLFTMAQTALENDRFGDISPYFVKASGIVLLAAYYFSLPSDEFLFDALQKHAIRYMLFFLGLHLLVAYVPFAGKSGTRGFWQFNRVLFIRFLTAILYSSVLYAGLAIALLSIHHLLGFEVDEDRYWQLWIIIFGIFNTWFFLSGIPKDFEALEQSSAYPKGLKIFTQYILIPLVIIYLIILYLYAGKIVVQWSWPIGWVSNLILGLSIVGIFALLLLFPVRNRGDHAWIKPFATYFYISLLPMVVLMLLAIWRRISEYSFTENRYFVLVAGIWLGAISLYFILSTRDNIKIIPASLAIIVFLSSFGPWGAFNISENSQTNRLQTILSEHEILQHGKMTENSESASVPIDDLKEISSIVRYLHDVHGYHELLSRLNVESGEWDELLDKSPHTFVEHFGLPYIRKWEMSPESERHFSVESDKRVRIDGYQWLHKNSYFYNNHNSLDLPVGEQQLVLTVLLDSAKIIVSPSENGETPKLSKNLNSWLDNLHNDYLGAESSNIPAGRMILEMGNGDLRVKIFVHRVKAGKQFDTWKIKNLSADILTSD